MKTIKHAQYNVTNPSFNDGEDVALQTDVVGNLKNSLAVALDPINDGLRTYPEGTYINLAASALVKTGSGRVQGVVINSHTTGTLKLWDNTSAATTVMNETISFAAGERFIPFFGETFGTGLYATIGGTANITIIYN